MKLCSFGRFMHLFFGIVYGCVCICVVYHNDKDDTCFIVFLGHVCKKLLENSDNEKHDHQVRTTIKNKGTR